MYSEVTYTKQLGCIYSKMAINMIIEVKYVVLGCVMYV